MSTSHWDSVPLSEIAEVRLGRQRSPKRAVGPNMRPYMRAANVTWNGISLHDVKKMDFTPAEFETYALRRGDLLLSEASGSASEVGKPAVWNEEIPDCCFQNTLIRVRAPESLVPFLHLHLYKDALTGEFARASRGVGIHHLGAKTLADWEVHLPPLEEQRRIVAIVDSYLTRLDNIAAALARVRRNLQRYRTSLLKAAVEGRLMPTEAELARTEGRYYEPASVLLQRILAARRRRWEQAELAKMKAAGRIPKNDKWKMRYKEPTAPDTAALPSLPEGWCWATWAQIGSSQNGRSFPSKHYCDHGVRLLRPGNLHVSGRVVWRAENTRFMPARYESDYQSYLVGPNELVMNLTAQSLSDEFLGRICLTDGTKRCFLNQRVARLEPILIQPRFLLWWFKTRVFREFVERLNTGSLIQHMFTSQLDTFAMPLPPHAEQARLTVEVERQMAVADSIEEYCESSKRRGYRLRQAVIHHVVNGLRTGR